MAILEAGSSLSRIHRHVHSALVNRNRAILVGLGFLVMVAYCPLFSSALALRWIIITAAVPFLRIDWRPLPIGVSALLIWMVIGFRWTPDIYYGEWYVFHCGLMLCIFFAAEALPSIDGVMVSAAWGLAVSVALMTSDRSGLFFNRDLLGEAAAIPFIWCILTRSASHMRLPMACVMAIAVIATGSRVALAAAFVGLLFDRRFRWGCALLLAPAVYWTYHDNKLASLDARLGIWKTSIGEITPWGHGLGWYEVAHPFWVYAHSDVLQGIVELGYVPVILAGCYGFYRYRHWPRDIDGGLLFGWLPAWRLEQCRRDIGGPPAPQGANDAPSLRSRTRTRSEDLLGYDAQRQAAWGALAGIAVEALISFPLHVPSTAFLAAVLMGSVVSDLHRSRGARDPRRALDCLDSRPSGDAKHIAARGAAGRDPIPVRSRYDAARRSDN